MHRESVPLFDIVKKKNAGGAGLDPNVRQAIERLRRAEAVTPR